MKREKSAATPYTTKDGSTIRELLHPGQHPEVRKQSLAEATVPPGAETLCHRHLLSEELYHISAGHGQMRLGETWFAIGPGDSIAIPPGTPHQLKNSGREPLVVLCCCTPPYSHEDTLLID